MRSTTYLSQWPEPRVLDYFWAMVGSGADRLPLLQQLSGVAVFRPLAWDTKTARQKIEALNLSASSCFSCLKRDRILYWHHVVEVQHGGASTLRNLVAICFVCHSTIHPWLATPGRKAEADHWTSVGAIAESVRAELIHARRSA